MEHPDPTLLLTRAEAQSRSFLSDVADRLGREPKAIVSPVLDIVPVGGGPDLDAYRTLIVTSGNAVAMMEGRLAGRTVVTVGARTAEKARATGADAVCLGETVDDLIGRIGEVAAPGLHLRGTHSRGDLAGRANAAGVRVDECVVYDQAERELSDEARKALAAGGVLVPLFSPRSASLLAQYPRHPEVRAIAISEAVADAWNGKSACGVAARPDRGAMLDMVLAAYGVGTH